MKDRKSYSGIKLIMHHFSLDGFEPIEKASNKEGDKDHFLQPKFEGSYQKYKKRQQEVAQLEKHLIFKLREFFKDMEPFPLLNKTKGKQHTNLSDTDNYIVNKVMAIVDGRK